MGLMSDKYTSLVPSEEFLSDPVVLAQAWKKSTDYIRRHNWYADVLELDYSILNIESHLEAWSRELRDRKFTPEKLRVVPAPKNCAWEFPSTETERVQAWRPKRDKEGNGDSQELRPLAHIGIRDQTICVAAMMCLADAVESLQGCTDQPDLESAQENGVFNYGNRLYCDWDAMPGRSARARFGWGNARTYSRYFEDYQRFLRRPSEACQKYEGLLAQGKVLHVVKLDIRRFFDRVNVPRLIRRLRTIYERFSEAYGASRVARNDPFWDLLAAAMRWEWDINDRAESKRLFGDGLPNGLPQGLVASGFFANAYMIRFDGRIGRKIGKHIDDRIILRDYCRYVDDIRLVIEADARADISDVASKVEDYFDRLLAWNCRNLAAEFKLELNRKKTEVVPYADFVSQSRASAQMSLLQGVLSGTPDLESLRQATAGLDNLLWLADLIETSDTESVNPLSLARIAVPRIDVRDDTLKRFAALRLVTTLRLRRSMSEGGVAVHEHPVVDHTGSISGETVLDHEFETTARKLIASWSRNPALVVVLRYGVDLFPSAELLRSVLNALESKWEPGANSDEKEKVVAFYVLADLLRAGAVETGFGHEGDYPSGSDILGYRRELERVALDVLDNDKCPWYLCQQAALFLASRGHCVQVEKTDHLYFYRLLHNSMAFKMPTRSETKDAIGVALVGQQMAPNKERFGLWFDRIMKSAKEDVIRDSIKTVGNASPDLLEFGAQTSGEKRAGWVKEIPEYLRARNYESGEWASLDAINGQWTSLSRIIRRDDNPFVQENALLSLALALVQRAKAGQLDANTHLLEIVIKCDDWSGIQNPRVAVDVLVQRNIGYRDDPRVSPPPWCREETQWAYAIGRILRSAITGEPDFTARRFLISEQYGQYRGLRSSWFRRRLGMLQTQEGLYEEPLPVSPWLSELIMRLLQWPGLEISSHLISGIESMTRPDDLVPILKRRQDTQMALYGVRSHLPVYVLPAVLRNEETRRGFRVAIVQTLLPRVEDFDPKNPCWWSSDYRRKHRAHLASMCRLVSQHVAAHSTAEGKGVRTTLDLIVFPELSVHEDDIFLLSRLSDVTEASIYAGLVFQPKGAGGKPINRALWLLRQASRGGRTLVRVAQGKAHMTEAELKMGVIGHRPYQVVIEFDDGAGRLLRFAGTICYDSTDLSLAADLRDVSDAFVVASLNKDTATFDNMVSALNYHMYQPVILANSGEFGGSTAQAPYRQRYEQVVAHVHGTGQAAVSIFELQLEDFKSIRKSKGSKEKKGPPAAYRGRH